MHDRNFVNLDLYQHLIVDHPELLDHVDKDIFSIQEIGACLRWEFNFEKYIIEDIDSLREYSVDFLLDSYNKDLLCYKAVSCGINELTVYMFFKDMDSVENCLKRRAFASYQEEIGREYKDFMKERNILINYFDFNEPQELLGTSKRNNWFTIIYLLISFPVFILIDSAPIQTIFFIGVIGFLTLWGTMFREKNK